MTLRLLRIAALVLVMMLSPAGVRAFGVNDVIQLQKEQVSDSLIVLAAATSGPPTGRTPTERTSTVLTSAFTTATRSGAGEPGPTHAQCVGAKLPPTRFPNSDMPMP